MPEMPYASVQDMIDRFGQVELVQLTDPDQIAVQPQRAQRALDDAQAFANGLLAQAYRLPLAGCRKPAPTPQNPRATEQAPPPQLVRIVCDVARYYLYDELAPEHEVALRYKAACAELRAIADGKAQLTCPWGGAPGETLTSGALGDGQVYSHFSPRQVTDEAVGSYR